ncbi:MAG: hypothetical protein KF850_34385 [Labilithrix sp.]|nr:hypothetical protein [Labilithrix sp.]MBX3217169.1 hypothetical protein [Labilithrix sp.]
MKPAVVVEKGPGAVETRIANVISAFLAARQGDRLASDLGALRFAAVGDVLLVEHEYAVFTVNVNVERRK